MHERWRGIARLPSSVVVLVDALLWLGAFLAMRVPVPQSFLHCWQCWWRSLDRGSFVRCESRCFRSALGTARPLSLLGTMLKVP